MKKQNIDFDTFFPFGTRLKEQTVLLGNEVPEGAGILRKTAAEMTICVSKKGGGVLLTGPAGKVGKADWTSASWLSVDVNFPQQQQFALCLCIGVYKEGQDYEKEAPYFGVLTGTFPNYKTRITVGFNEFACKNGFLPRTPGKLKTVCGGLPIKPEEISALYIGARACHEEQVIELSNLCLTDKEPDYPMEQRIMVDELGQWTEKDWPGKMKSVEELTRKLNRELEAIGQGGDPIPGRSKWGGNLSMKLTEGSGYYSTYRDENGKWWLTDPEGYAYFVMGLEGITPGSSGVVNEWRESYSWLPDKDGEFACAWSETYGDPNQARRVAYSENIDFAKINLIRAFGRDWEEKWARLTSGRLDAWGINNAGISGSPHSKLMGDSPLKRYRRMPAFHFVGSFPQTKVSVFRDFPDVFSKEYEEASEKYAEGLSCIAGDPWIVGYFMTNEPEWAFIDNLEISEMLLANPAKLKTKDVLIDFLREKYETPRQFNTAWNLSIADFEELKKPLKDAAKLSAQAAADLNAFSYKMIEEYVRVPAEKCREKDPHHLNFGFRYPYISYPNQTAGHQYLDVFDINDYRYDPKEYLEWIGSLVDMPVMVSEFHHGSLDRGLPVTGIRGVRTQEDRGIAYRYYIERGASTDYFVGSVYFIYSDQPILCTSYQENYNIGFVDICSMPHRELTGAVRETALRVYDVHTGKERAFDTPPDIIPLNAC